MPRFIHHMYAAFMGYFWIPCPLCREYFGGHEWRNNNCPDIPIPDKPGHGHGICKNCATARGKIIKLNSQFIADATRSHLERDPRNMVGARMIDELAIELQDIDGKGKIVAFRQMGGLTRWARNQTAQNRV